MECVQEFEVDDQALHSALAVLPGSGATYVLAVTRLQLFDLAGMKTGQEPVSVSCRRSGSDVPKMFELASAVASKSQVHYLHCVLHGDRPSLVFVWSMTNFRRR
jgi:hypothetical protein